MIPLSVACTAELARLEIPLPKKVSGIYETEAGLLGVLHKNGRQLDVRGLRATVDGVEYVVSAALERCVVIELSDGARKLAQTTDCYVDEAAVKWVPVPKVRGGVRERWRTA